MTTRLLNLQELKEQQHGYLIWPVGAKLGSKKEMPLYGKSRPTSMSTELNEI